MSLIKCKECGEVISNKAKTCPKCGSPVKNKSIVRSILFWIFIIFVIGTIFNTATDRTQRQVNNEGRKLSKTEEAIKKIELGYIRWERVAFDTAISASFTLKNGNDFNVKDVEISCTLFAMSGTEMGKKEFVIYDLFLANSEQKITNFNVGFVHPQVVEYLTKCEVIGVSGFRL
ncbi:MAG: zinc ribbon domain-containing protein [Rheinheimera sp.]|nr:MAG: zinc ribbon domain-containing protein [Rheinheimera sp.]